MRALTLLNDEELTILVPRVFIEERRRETAVRDLENKVKSEPFEEALEAVDEALRNGNIDNRRWEELTLYLWSTEARRRSQGGKWLDGWRFLGESPERTQRIVRWDELLETYRHNAVVSVHNDFISAMRRNQHEEARRILDDAAEIFPDDPTLEQDRRALESRTGG
jgi:tetratricopeptide (TPR) repeat protein